MITISTGARAIAVIRKELSEVVLPTVTDPRSIKSLQMIDFTLRQLEVAQDHQLIWMREEISEIRNLAARVTAERPGENHVGAALVALDAGRASTDEMEDVRREYSLAGELLSCIVETVMPTADHLRDAAIAVLERRLSRELLIRGEFQIVGQQ